MDKSIRTYKVYAGDQVVETDTMESAVKVGLDLTRDAANPVFHLQEIRTYLFRVSRPDSIELS